MTPLQLKLLGTTLLFFSSQATVFAGVVFEVETTEHSGSSNSSRTMKMSVEGKNIKMEILPGSSGSGLRGTMIPPSKQNPKKVKKNRANTGTILSGGAGGGNVLNPMKDMAIAQMNAQLNAGTITTEQYQASLKMINQTFKPVKRTWGKDIDRSKIKRPKTIRRSNTAIATDTAMDAASVATEVPKVITNSSSEVSNTSVSDDASVITNTNSITNAIDGLMIYNTERREMVVVNPESKEYFVMNDAFLTTMKDNFGDVAEQMNGMSGMMEQAYQAALAQLDAQDLSPEERTAAEQMLRNTFGISSLPTNNSSPQLEIVEGNTSNIKISGNNYTAQNVKVFLGKILEKELLVVDFKQLVKNAKERKTLKDYFDFLSKMRNLKGQRDSSQDIFADISDIGGFPVVTRSFEDGEVDEEWKLKSVTERDLDPDAFEPPSGYRLRTMGGFFQ